MQTAGTALVVVAHHRPDSLTVHIGERVASRLAEAGFEVDVLDLHREHFDPRMNVEDQPDWSDRDKVYSELTRSHQDRLLAADVIVPVFPVYWFSVPAILKGWIDRVWGYGFAYGRSQPRLAGKRMLWLGLAGTSAEDPMSPKMHQAIEEQLRDGVSYFCGIAEAGVEVLFGSEAQPQTVDEQGTLIVGEPLEGAEREAFYADFGREATGHVEKFFSLS
ncbi:NAD(P)H oxidoreductase [Glycomyces xiaoerkulensis]|uniref:NAD(P)H oxidoreductase n=1 Tax=Glycomyces xiaoerkulensis TaxID=2038139 RepID=UPI000C25F257|nr:NAD(P)H oxidoreductase [Glycomyces xiaoerkulensis]